VGGVIGALIGGFRLRRILVQGLAVALIVIGFGLIGEKNGNLDEVLKLYYPRELSSDSSTKAKAKKREAKR
jgi:hypothetical protein